jgi:putative transposon-encoded protein
MPKQYVSEDIKLETIILKGYVLEKTVRNMGTSGVIFVPKRWVGKQFKVVLIPKEDTDSLII